jgi:hypothetical protein
MTRAFSDAYVAAQGGYACMIFIASTRRASVPW